MNVRIFWVRAMKCMRAQTRPRFILSSEGVFGGMEFEPMLTPREKSPLPENVPRGGSNPRPEYKPPDYVDILEMIKWRNHSTYVSSDLGPCCLVNHPNGQVVRCLPQEKQAWAWVQFHLTLWIFFQVESYQWLENWYSSGFPARHLAWSCQCWDWLAQC